MTGVSFASAQEAATTPSSVSTVFQADREPVDFVNPYMGNISHLLVPTFPTVSRPNSLLRIVPDRESFTSSTVGGLNLLLTSHRSASVFRLRPFEGANDGAVRAPERYTYDQEKTTPYRYSVFASAVAAIPISRHQCCGN